MTSSRVTADTNIYISALNFGGHPEILLNLARKGVVELAISDAILAEVERVLTLKFHWPSGLLQESLLEIRAFTRHVEPRNAINLITVDPTDNRILECAEAAQSEYMVSGDKHLLSLKMFRSIPILPVIDFLRLLNNSFATPVRVE